MSVYYCYFVLTESGNFWIHRIIHFILYSYVIT